MWQSLHWVNLLKTSHQADATFQVAGLFVEKRKIALGKHGLFVLGGELPTREQEQELIALGKQENVVFVQYETWSLIEAIDWDSLQFHDGYYKKFITPYTALIDLSQSQDEILALMKPKGRYNIKLAEKKWVFVSTVPPTESNIEIFHTLMLETTARDGFHGNTQAYYQAFLTTIPWAKLLFARVEEVVVSAGIFVFSPEVSIYYYGASTSQSEYRNLMAPYALQWHAITESKALGSKYYDFLWVASPNEPNSSLAGVTDFKGKFTPDFRLVSHAKIWVHQKCWYWGIQLLRKWKENKWKTKSEK